MLEIAGIHPTDANIDGLATRTAFAIGTQAAAYFAQAGDAAAFDRYVAKFAKHPITTRPRSTCDEMLDWLWDWDKRCHDALIVFVEKWQDSSTKGFLAGQTSVPSLYTGTEINDIEAWGTVFQRNM